MFIINPRKVFHFCSLFKNHNWDELYAITDVDNSLKYFYDHMHCFLDISVPKQQIKSSCSKPRFPLWYSMDLIRKIREKIGYIV